MCWPAIAAVASIAGAVTSAATSIVSAEKAGQEKRRLRANEFDVATDQRNERSRRLAASLASLEASSGGFGGGTIGDVGASLRSDAGRDFRNINKNSANRLGDIDFAADQQQNAAIFDAVGAVTRGVGQVAGTLRTPTSTDTAFDFGSGRPISYGDGDDDYRQLSRGGFFSAS